MGGGVTLEVLWTPGHSPGSLALFCPQEGVLITADSAPPTGGLPLYAGVDQARASLRRLAGIPGIKKLYTFMRTILSRAKPLRLTGDARPADRVVVSVEVGPRKV